MLFTGFALMITGQTFMFESTIGIIYSTLFALTCLKIDQKFYKYCDKTAFDIKYSRRYKFYALFFMNSAIHGKYNCKKLISRKFPLPTRMDAGPMNTK